jgi:hypothetical protein
MYWGRIREKEEPIKGANGEGYVQVGNEVKKEKHEN